MFRMSEKRHNRLPQDQQKTAKDEIFRRRFIASVNSPRFWL